MFAANPEPRSGQSNSSNDDGYLTPHSSGNSNTGSVVSLLQKRVISAILLRTRFSAALWSNHIEFCGVWRIMHAIHFGQTAPNIAIVYRPYYSSLCVQSIYGSKRDAHGANALSISSNFKQNS